MYDPTTTLLRITYPTGRITQQRVPNHDVSAIVYTAIHRRGARVEVIVR